MTSVAPLGPPCPSVREIIENDDFISAVDELLGDDGADEAGATGDEDPLLHGWNYFP